MMQFNSRFTETISMFTRTGDTYGPDGRFVPGAETETPIIASVQRMNMRERELLPEGFRGSESYKIYTEVDVVQIIENNVQPLVDAAEFQYRGKRFVMLSSEEWDYLIPHWKVTVVEKAS